jgi:hypothetical protein
MFRSIRILIYVERPVHSGVPYLYSLLVPLFEVRSRGVLDIDKCFAKDTSL